MLLPSTDSNPANVIAQVFGIYKRMLGNASSNGGHETSPLELTEGMKDSADESAISAETRDKSAAISKVAGTDHLGEHGFSLQSPKNRQ